MDQRRSLSKKSWAVKGGGGGAGSPPPPGSAPERPIRIPRMRYQNFTPMEEWEIYVFAAQRNVSFVVFSGVILHLPQIN